MNWDWEEYHKAEMKYVEMVFKKVGAKDAELRIAIWSLVTEYFKRLYETILTSDPKISIEDSERSSGLKNEFSNRLEKCMEMFRKGKKLYRGRSEFKLNF